MPLDNVTQDQVAERDKLIYVTSATRLTPQIRSVQASTVSGTGAFTIWMTSPMEALIGVPIIIYMVARNGTDDITIKVQGLSDIVLNAAAEYTVLTSDGVRFYELVKNHT